MKIDQVQVTWSLLIVVAGLLILPVTSCVEHQDAERTKQVQIMSKHCAEQGKTFKAEQTQDSKGLCI
jgi:putative hemolysin